MLEKNLSPKGVILNWLQPPALQIHLRASHLAGPEGAGEAVEDPSSDEELFFSSSMADVALWLGPYTLVG